MTIQGVRKGSRRKRLLLLFLTLERIAKLKARSFKTTESVARKTPSRTNLLRLPAKMKQRTRKRVERSLLAMLPPTRTARLRRRDLSREKPQAATLQVKKKAKITTMMTLKRR